MVTVYRRLYSHLRKILNKATMAPLRGIVKRIMDTICGDVQFLGLCIDCGKTTEYKTTKPYIPGHFGRTAQFHTRRKWLFFHS